MDPTVSGTISSSGGQQFPATRRRMLAEAGAGFGTLALAGLLQRDGVLAANEEPSDLLPRPGHARPRARAVIQLFQNGGPSQMDLFDEKPELTRQHGKVPSREIETFQPVSYTHLTLPTTPYV